MTPLDIRLLKVLSDIKGQLARIGTGRQANDQQDHPQPAPIVTVNAVLELPPAVRSYYESQNKRPWGKWLKNLLEVAAVCAAFWLGYLNWGVLNEIKKQTPEMRRSAKAAADAAKAAQDSITLTRENFIKDQRPWIFMDATLPEPTQPHDAQGRFMPGQHILWRISFSDYGRTPAIHAVTGAEIFFGATARAQGDAYFVKLPRLLIGPATLVPPGGPPVPEPLIPGGPPVNIGRQFSTVVSRGVPTADDLVFIYSHDFAVVVVGRVQYKDSFDNLYWTDFCFSTFISGAINNCYEHNEAH